MNPLIKRALPDTPRAFGQVKVSTGTVNGQAGDFVILEFEEGVMCIEVNGAEALAIALVECVRNIRLRSEVPETVQ